MNQAIDDRRGAAAVEFAFVAPMFLLLVFFILQVGLSLFTQVVLDNATNAAARQIQIGSTTGASLSTVRALICSKTFYLVPSCTSNLQIYATSATTFSGLVSPTFSGSTMTPTTFTPGGSGSYVLLEVAYKRPFSLPMASTVTGKFSISVVAFESEPY